MNYAIDVSRWWAALLGLTALAYSATAQSVADMEPEEALRLVKDKYAALQSAHIEMKMAVYRLDPSSGERVELQTQEVEVYQKGENLLWRSADSEYMRGADCAVAVDHLNGFILYDGARQALGEARQAFGTPEGLDFRAALAHRGEVELLSEGEEGRHVRYRFTSPLKEIKEIEIALDLQKMEIEEIVTRYPDGGFSEGVSTSVKIERQNLSASINSRFFKAERYFSFSKEGAPSPKGEYEEYRLITLN